MLTIGLGRPAASEAAKALVKPCPGWDSNPHAPVGDEGFKALKWHGVPYRLVPENAV